MVNYTKKRVKCIEWYRKDSNLPDISVFNNAILFDALRFQPNCIRYNKEFSQTIAGIRALDRSKLGKPYNQGDLIRDMEYFFDYLPTDEIGRFVNCVFWLMTSAMRTLSWVWIKNFGQWRVTALSNNNSPAPRFFGSARLRRLCTPRTQKYTICKPDGNVKARRPNIFSCWVDEKLHWRLGKNLVQKAFDKKFRWLGYTDQYLNMLASNEIIRV